LADAARPDKADHRRSAHIDLEPQQSVADEVRQHLRGYGEAHLREPAGPGRSDTFDGGHVDIFHHLGEQLAERTSGVDRYCQYAGQSTEPECGDKDQREDDVGNRTAELEAAPHGKAHPGSTHQIAAGWSRCGKCSDHARYGRDIGDQQSLAEQPTPPRQTPEPFLRIGPYPRPGVELQQAVEVAGEIPDMVPQGDGSDLCTDGRDHQCNRDQHYSESELPALRRDCLSVVADRPCKLRGGGNGYQAGQSTKAFGPGLSVGSSPGARTFRQLLFLRSRSTNWISLMVSS
jgi:hypothetical protein